LAFLFQKLIFAPLEFGQLFLGRLKAALSRRIFRLDVFRHTALPVMCFSAVYTQHVEPAEGYVSRITE